MYDIAKIDILYERDTVCSTFSEQVSYQNFIIVIEKLIFRLKKGKPQQFYLVNDFLYKRLYFPQIF